jgi:hypothetical protein
VVLARFLIGGWVASAGWVKSDAARRFAAAMAETARCACADAGRRAIA